MSTASTPPADEFRVELTARPATPGRGDPSDAAQRVSGPALDFCLLVTQRRHRDDLAVHADGAEADAWLTSPRRSPDRRAKAVERGSSVVNALRHGGRTRTPPLRIGNASGFYGDRFEAVREMLTGGELDVLTGDYLAELTMLILARTAAGPHARVTPRRSCARWRSASAWRSSAA